MRGQRDRRAVDSGVDGSVQCEDDAGLSCGCASGYRTTERGCEDIDECLQRPGLCGSHARCDNLEGSHACVCDEGFVEGVDGCEATAGCSELGLLCHPDATCSEADVGCMCARGFEGDGVGCVDVDECAEDAECGSRAACRNTRGGFVCDCDAVSVRGSDGSCVDACDLALADGSTCASAGALCALDQQGTPVCSACASGYLGDGKACVADAACAALDCGSNTECVNDAGDRACACAPGFEGDPEQGCRDVDECQGATPCGEKETCVNVSGGFVCACAPGYARVDGTCRDVDECAEGRALCDPNATCENSAPGYRCECKAGFAGDGFSCRDVDECATGSHDCVEVEACQNTSGGFGCACRAGTVGDGRSAPCYCDLSGYWAMRQDVTLTVPEQSVGNTIFISETITQATIWELHRYDYDGETIVVQKRGCGADRPPLVTSAYFEEVYSSSVPNAVFDKLEALPGNDIPLPSSMAMPGTEFVTPPEAAVLGITLPDPESSPWPATRYDVSMDAWVDVDMDQVPGISMWPASTLDPTGLPEAETFSYVPVEFSPGTTVVNRRAGCVSIGTRVKTQLQVEVEACDRWVGTVDNLGSEVRVFGCTVMSENDADTLPVQCDAQSWRKARRCTAQQVDFLDTQEQQQTATATFELVRIADLTAEDINCESVRSRLPPIPRD